MTIGIDGNEANVANKVGISEYCYELLKQFRRGMGEGDRVKFLIYLKDKPNDDMPEESEHWEYRVVRPRKFWTQAGLPLYLYSRYPRPDIFFSPTHYAPRFSPIPTVVSVMDLSFLYFPELFRKSDLYQLTSWTKYSVRNAAKVLTISESSKSDIIKEYKISPDKVVVTYPGIKEMEKHKMENVKELKKKYGLENPYLLFVGTLQPRKNIVTLMEAFKILKESGSKNKELSSLDLVIVGKKGWLYEDILSAPQRLGIESYVKFLDYVPDEDMPALYAHARLYVLPSLYEGFGLPVLEAMKYDCPVATSNISSLPEAGGDAAVYFNPEDPKDIAKVIGSVLADEKKREQMIRKGREQVKKFSWEKTAKETLEVLTELGSKR